MVWRVTPAERFGRVAGGRVVARPGTGATWPPVGGGPGLGCPGACAAHHHECSLLRLARDGGRQKARVDHRPGRRNCCALSGLPDAASEEAQPFTVRAVDVGTGENPIALAVHSGSPFPVRRARPRCRRDPHTRQCRTLRQPDLCISSGWRCQRVGERTRPESDENIVNATLWQTACTGRCRAGTPRAAISAPCPDRMGEMT